MNLRNIYKLCKKNVDALKSVTATHTTSTGRNGYTVSSWIICREAVCDLRQIDALEEQCDNVLSSVPAFVMNKNTFGLATEEWNKINSAKSILISSVENIIRLYESMGCEDDETIDVDFLLPECEDFSKFVHYVKELDFILTKCPFLQSKEEKIQFKNVDVGSTWLSFAIIGGGVLVGSILLNNLAAFVDKCIVVRSHYLTCQKQKADLESEEENKEKKKIILEYIENTYKKVIDCAIDDLEKTTNYTVKNEDGDEPQRIKQCIEKMGELIENGLRIYSAIDAPEEARALFEPLEMKYLTVGKEVKVIEEKPEE